MIKLTPKEIENVLKLDAFARYKHSIKRIADNTYIYFLADSEGNFALAEIDGQVLFSIWPAREYAELNKTDKWNLYSIIEINLDEFIVSVIPIIESNNYLLNVFSANNNTGFIVSMEEFKRDLNEELSNYD